MRGPPLTDGTVDANLSTMAVKSKTKKKGFLKGGKQAKVVVRTSARTKSGAVAVHDESGVDHVVGIGDLRVMIVQEDKGCWFARGLEIDFAEQGTSLEDVKFRFEKSLADTIKEHLTVRGSIRDLLHVAPPDVWNEFWDGVTGQRLSLSCVTAHSLLPRKEQAKTDGKHLPFFDKIAYHSSSSSAHA